MAGALRLLADGTPVPVQRLCRELALEITEVERLLERLERSGLSLRRHAAEAAVSTGPMELLDPERIGQALGEAVRERLLCVEVFARLASTNTYLIGQPAPPPGAGRVCLAEWQDMGRGRRGRRWVSPPGRGLCLSLGWSLAAMRGNVAPVALVCGVAAVRALRGLGVEGVCLKWPNDLLLGDAKLGGILAESRSGAAGVQYLVVGIGINMDLDSAAGLIAPGGSAPATDLRQCRGTSAPGRNCLAAAVLEELVMALDRFQLEGFAAFLPQWRQLDALQGREVAVQSGGKVLQGVVRGVDEGGALLLQVGDRMVPVVSGEASLRTLDAIAD